jgi:hypothetical protein
MVDVGQDADLASIVSVSVSRAEARGRLEDDARS